MTIGYKSIAFLLAFALGIIGERYFALGLTWFVGALVLSLIFLLYYRFSRAGVYLLASFFSLGLALGMGRLALSTALVDHDFDQYLGQEITLEAKLMAEPDEREVFTQLLVRPLGRRERLLINLPREAVIDLFYGDRLQVTGRLAPPYRGVPFTIDYELKSAEVEFLSRPTFSLRRSLFGVKRAFLESAKRVYPEPAAGFIAGLIFGEKHALGGVWEERFRAAGLSHIVVLSGYNLTLVATIILTIFGFCKLPRRASLLLGALGIIVFTLATGGSAATVRAAVMALVALLARLSGRSYEAGRALFFAGFLMLLYEPRLLTDDLGFQLSFLATIGLIYFVPPVEKLFAFWPKERFKFFREVTLTTLAVQIFLLPWLLFKFGVFPLLALPANILVLPLVPIVMLLGFLASLIGLVSVPLAWPLLVLSYPLFSFQFGVTKIFAASTAATITVEQLSGLIVLLSYLFYGAWVYWYNRR